LGRRALQRRNHRRREQYVAVMAQLDHQDTAQSDWRKDFNGHGRILPERGKLPTTPAKPHSICRLVA
jgi:hypothetical protein